MLNKIPTTVITGFLGAGKTTLIRHLINNAAGRKIALIINEFGDLGVGWWLGTSLVRMEMRYILFRDN